jgi:predicted RNA binding protein YcfA (HicA-like mRNA interferase family)
LDQALFNAGENKLQASVRETTKAPLQPLHEWDIAPRLTQSFFNLQSNIYTVVPVGQKPVLPHNVFPVTCSTKDMIRICERAGYTLNSKGGKGSHVKLEKSGRCPVILPNRKDLSVGVVKNALAAVGDYKLADLPRLL